MKPVIAIFFLLYLLTGLSFAETTDRIAAIVNGEIITTPQLDRRVMWERDVNNLRSLSEEDLNQLQRQVLEWMIDEKLLTQKSRELGLTVSEIELEYAIDDAQRQFNLTREQLISALADEGIAFSRYREELKEEILRSKLIGQEASKRAKITDREIQAYFQEHIDEYRRPQTVHLQRISFEVPGDASLEQQAAIRELAEKVRDKIMNQKQPFNVVMASLDNTALVEDMGSLEVDSLQPIFQGPIRSLKLGEVSVPIAAYGGLHLFLVLDRNTGERDLTEKIKDEIEMILKVKNTDKSISEWIQELRRSANIEIQL